MNFPQTLKNVYLKKSLYLFINLYHISTNLNYTSAKNLISYNRIVFHNSELVFFKIHKVKLIPIEIIHGGY